MTRAQMQAAADAHFAEAERILANLTANKSMLLAQFTTEVARAQAHATLALAGFTKVTGGAW